MARRSRSDTSSVYGPKADLVRDEQEATVIRDAIGILTKRLRKPDKVLNAPGDAKRLAQLKLADCLSEVFAVMWLDNRHRLIDFEPLFRGTVDGATVHPREVVRSALAHNAAAAILMHNHPSGVAEPSRADEQLTRRLKDALALIDVRVLDHLVVGADEVLSFAERGLL